MTPRELVLPELPYPPTVNTYWRRRGRRVVLSAGAVKFRQDVLAILRGFKFKAFRGEVEVAVVFYPPDRRKRDLDNLPKGLFDSLKHAGIYEDDSQIRRVDMRFGPVTPGGKSSVAIRELAGDGGRE